MAIATGILYEIAHQITPLIIILIVKMSRNSQYGMFFFLLQTNLIGQQQNRQSLKLFKSDYSSISLIRVYRNISVQKISTVKKWRFGKSEQELSNG